MQTVWLFMPTVAGLRGALAVRAPLRVLAQFFEQAFWLKVRVPFQHLHGTVAGDACDFHGIQTLLKESRCRLVTQIVPTKRQKLWVALPGGVEGAFPDADNCVYAGGKYRSR